jgi:hypothetical protein
MALILILYAIISGLCFSKLCCSCLFLKEEEVVQAAKLANCHDFIMSFEDKYQTIIGKTHHTFVTKTFLNFNNNNNNFKR